MFCFHCYLIVKCSPGQSNFIMTPTQFFDFLCRKCQTHRIDLNITLFIPFYYTFATKLKSGRCSSFFPLGYQKNLSNVISFFTFFSFFRRSYFEVFWFTHHLFVVFFIGMLFHGFGWVDTKGIILHQPCNYEATTIFDSIILVMRFNSLPMNT